MQSFHTAHQLVVIVYRPTGEFKIFTECWNSKDTKKKLCNIFTYFQLINIVIKQPSVH